MKLVCPYCDRLLIIGAVTIKGEKYKCSHCKVWFEEVDNKLVKTDYLKVI